MNTSLQHFHTAAFEKYWRAVIFSIAGVEIILNV